jgi:hypothetical protein
MQERGEESERERDRARAKKEKKEKRRRKKNSLVYHIEYIFFSLLQREKKHRLLSYS